MKNAFAVRTDGFLHNPKCMIGSLIAAIPVRLRRLRVVASLLALPLFCYPQLLFAQQPDQEPPSPISGTIESTTPRGTNPADPEQKRIFGIIPNFRTSPSLSDYKPLTPAQKFKIASQDSFDRGTFVLAMVFAGESQLTNSNPSFGHGAAAYGRYLGTAYADFVIGDFMTEGIYPSLIHQDPRYFRRGSGSGLSRLAYSAGQIFRTRTDAGGTQFNYSEILGNATAVAISNAFILKTATSETV